MKGVSAFWPLYGSAVLARITLAFFSPGYIHPDEWFQFGEVLVGDLLDQATFRTWEFDPSYPCRSMASIAVFGLPLRLIIHLFRLLGRGMYKGMSHELQNLFLRIDSSVH